MDGFLSRNADPREPHGESTDGGQVLCKKQLMCCRLLRAAHRLDARCLTRSRLAPFAEPRGKRYHGANGVGQSAATGASYASRRPKLQPPRRFVPLGRFARPPTKRHRWPTWPNPLGIWVIFREGWFRGAEPNGVVNPFGLLTRERESSGGRVPRSGGRGRRRAIGRELSRLGASS